MEATQGDLFRLEHWSEYWCLPCNPSKCEASFFSVDAHQANLQPNLFLLGSRLHFNPIPTFLGVTFNCTLSFSKHVSSLKAKFIHISKPYTESLLAHGAPLRSPSLFYINLFFSLFSLTLHLDGSFLKCYQYHKIGMPHRAASRAMTGCLSSSPIPLLSEASLPPLRVTLTHFTPSSYEQALHLPTSFCISGLARLVVKPRLCRSSWRAFASTHSLMLPCTCSREALLYLPSLSFLESAFLSGLGSWPNIGQVPALELTIFKFMAPAPAPELVFRFMWSQLQLQSCFQGFTNVVKCNIFLAMDFTDNITLW